MEKEGVKFDSKVRVYEDTLYYDLDVSILKTPEGKYVQDFSILRDSSNNITLQILTNSYVLQTIPIKFNSGAGVSDGEGNYYGKLISGSLSITSTTAQRISEANTLYLSFTYAIPRVPVVEDNK